MSFNLLWPHILSKVGITNNTINDINTKITDLTTKINNAMTEIQTNKNELDALYNQLLNQVEVLKNTKQNKLKPLGAIKMDEKTNEIYLRGDLDTALNKLPDLIKKVDGLEKRIVVLENK